ncbi:MAG: hypothetical protein HYV18_04365 [Gammaproteobacteria bacterium]|nr:hypothetical protein [Gammaproteobacteria bacterium]
MIRTILAFSIAAGIAGCGASAPDSARAAAAPAQPSSADDGIRTIPDPACADAYGGTTGLFQRPVDPGVSNAAQGGTAVSAEVAATLPRVIHLRGPRDSYTADYYFATRDGHIYITANREPTGTDEPWRQMSLPSCLDGNVTEISADGRVLLALDEGRWVYTLDLEVVAAGSAGWTRRWGPFFWTDFGIPMPSDVTAWATSELTPEVDGTFTDRAGNEQVPAGILTVYLLRGDGQHITYIDPWLPSDESREVCGPERNTLRPAGLSGSGSTVMVVTREGDIYTRLYEFDVSGANTVFLDYAWEDQRGAADPPIQLPAPDWVRHPRIPGRHTDRLSLRKLSPGTQHRVMRVEGRDAQGHTGYWQKDLADREASDWAFVATGEALQGRSLPLPAPYRDPPEDYAYAGTIEGWKAELLDFNPYCSPATLRLHIGQSGPLELILHTTDGLRQERRARGLDGYPHNYRSAVEVPAEIWARRGQLAPEAQAFLQKHFTASRFLDGPLMATQSRLQLQAPCWTLRRDAAVADEMLPAVPPDMGQVVAELTNAQEEGRNPQTCPWQ